LNLKEEDFVSATARRAPVRRSTLNRWFRVEEMGSRTSIEILGGSVTFLAMCYILFVNPNILAGHKDSTGHALPFNQVLTVTALGAGVMSICMGVFAKKPFALAPGLGINAFVAFGLVLGPAKLPWPDAMGVIVVEGALIALMVLVKNLRERVINAIPTDLKKAIGIGIGLFITMIGLVNAGVVVRGNGTLVGLAPHYRGWPLMIFAIGLVVTAALVKLEAVGKASEEDTATHTGSRGRATRRGLPGGGALIYGIIFTTVLATVVNAFNHNHVFTDGSAKLPSSWIWPDFGLVGHVSFHFWNLLGPASAIATLVAVGMSDLFDTAGTGYGISARAEQVNRTGAKEREPMLNPDGTMPRAKWFLFWDAVGAFFGGLISSSSITTYLESASGVAAGARTGLAAVVTGLLFIASLVLAPIAGIVPAVATAPILVLVGSFMIPLAKEIDWDDPQIALPALLTAIVMPATYSITNGVGVGFITYTAVAILTRNVQKKYAFVYLFAAVFAWYFWHGIVG
jgi:AGZA family xanthine/uracil permease-like MFS transporter